MDYTKQNARTNKQRKYTQITLLYFKGTSFCGTKFREFQVDP